MKTTTLTKTQTRVTARTGEQHEISRKAVATMAAPAALVGLWAVACLVSAMVSSGGPLGLARAWVQAVAGF